MAENIVLDLTINAAQSANTVKELKQSLKDLVDQQANVAAGSKDWKKLANAINDTEGKIGELNDGMKTFTGSGLDRANSSISLFSEGISSFDPGKMMQGLKGLGAALKAVPLLLIAEVVAYLVTNFNELTEGTGILAKVLKPLADLIGWLTDKLYELTDALGLTNSALDEMGEAVAENAKKGTEALNAQITAFDQQMKVAAAAGKSTLELEKAKQQAIIDTNVLIAKQIEAFVRAGGELDDEKKKLLTASIAAIKAAKVEEFVIEAKHDTEVQKKNEEAAKKRKELKDKELADSQKLADELFNLYAKEEDEAIASEKRRTEALKKEAEERQAIINKGIETQHQINLAEIEEFRILGEEKKRLAKEQEDAITLAKQQGLVAAQNLSQAFFAIQLAGAKGNAAKELEIKKKMFEVDKAFNIARATQDGIRSVQAALTIPPPGGQILAGINAALAAANIAKIAATKFDGGGGASASSVGATGGAVNIPNIQTQPINTQAPSTLNTTTFDANGVNQNNRVYVVESDITKSQNRIARLEEQATI